MKNFEFHGSQRDLSPELKRIVKKLANHECSYNYCHTCKKYEQLDFDSLDNIKKFLDFIRMENDKLFPKKKPA